MATESHPMKQDGNRGKSSKYFTNFRYKASLALIFLVIIPLFPSQAPEFINQTVPNKSWELLQLIFVGIVVSYGLFSSRNQEETEKEPNPSKFDSAQSYVSRLLQVSSVFDDEPEIQSGSTDEISKLETWSNQYLRNEPVVVLAKEQRPSVVDQRRVGSVGSSSRNREKPLLLPVRSLKSRALDDANEPVDQTSHVSSNPSVSSSSTPDSKRSAGSSNLPSQMNSSQKLGGSEEKEAAVLRSPIPWRTRSGRMGVKEELPSPFSPLSFMGGFEYSSDKPEASKPQMSTSFWPNSSPRISPSLKKSSISSELQAKTAEDFMTRKSFPKSPPPPPPPPPPVTLKSSSMMSRSSSGSLLGEVSSNKDLRRSYSSDQKYVSRVHSGIEMKPRSIPLHDARRSVGTFQALKGEEFGEYGAQEAEDVTLLEKTRMGTADIVSNLSILELPEAFVEDVPSESDEDFPASENEIEAAPGVSKNEELSQGNGVIDGGPDVDKKADEFIAKFREQIRLQRIDSIKRSSAEISRNLLR